jgi:hypothetical protein
MVGAIDVFGLCFKWMNNGRQQEVEPRQSHGPPLAWHLARRYMRHCAKDMVKGEGLSPLLWRCVKRSPL